MSAVLAVVGVTEQDIGENDDLAQLGIDSMQVVEVRQTLQRALGRPFPLDEVRNDMQALKSALLRIPSHCYAPSVHERWHWTGCS